MARTVWPLKDLPAMAFWAFKALVEESKWTKTIPTDSSLLPGQSEGGGGGHGMSGGAR